MNVVVENLSKSYGAQKAVDDLSFELKTGEILGFLGPNGAGKSTTMKMMANYLEVESGDILVGNQSVKTHGDEIRKLIGYLPENNPLYLDMPVIEYLEFCAALQGLTGTHRNQRVREMIAVCGIDREKHKKIGELSKGYRQRVGLAQAMIHNPEILILDEPTTGLDPNQIVEIRNLIKKIGKEKTIILSTHILPEVEATCDRILIINHGKIVADGTPESLKKQASGLVFYRLGLAGKNLKSADVAIRLFDGVKQVDAMAGKPGYFDVQCQPESNFPEQLFKFCNQNQQYIIELTPTETSLEDIFHGLTVS